MQPEFFGGGRGINPGEICHAYTMSIERSIPWKVRIFSGGSAAAGVWRRIRQDSPGL
jgi:hypothetical protein